MNQISLTHEIYRKIIHFLLLLVPVAYCYLGKWTSLLIFASISVVVVGFDYMRRQSPAIKVIFQKMLGPILRPHEQEGDRLCGASMVAIAACVTFLLFEASIAVTAFSILVISDAFAAIIGRNFPSKAFFEKSVSGATAFFVTGLITLITCGIIFEVRFLFYIFAIFALFCVTIIESRPSLLKMDDNFTIPIIFSVIMTIFDMIWGYSV